MFRVSPLRLEPRPFHQPSIDQRSLPAATEPSARWPAARSASRASTQPRGTASSAGASAVALMELIIKLPGMLLGLQGAANLYDVAPGGFGEVSLELMRRGWFAAAIMALLLVAAMAAIMSTADSSDGHHQHRRQRPLPPRPARRARVELQAGGVGAMAAAVGLSYVFTDLSALWILQNSLLMVGVAPSFVLGLYALDARGLRLLRHRCRPRRRAQPRLCVHGRGGRRRRACWRAMPSVWRVVALTAGCHAAERRWPQAASRRRSRRWPAASSTLRAHDPAYDAEPLVLAAQLGGLVEPLQGGAPCSPQPSPSARPSTCRTSARRRASWHLTGIPGWACVTLFFASAGCATSPTSGRAGGTRRGHAAQARGRGGAAAAAGAVAERVGASLSSVVPVQAWVTYVGVAVYGLIVVVLVSSSGARWVK